jgi:hypothetical protein
MQQSLLNEIRQQSETWNEIQRTLEAVDPSVRIMLPDEWFTQLDEACTVHESSTYGQPLGAIRA